MVMILLEVGSKHCESRSHLEAYHVSLHKNELFDMNLLMYLQHYHRQQQDQLL